MKLGATVLYARSSSIIAPFERMIKKVFLATRIGRFTYNIYMHTVRNRSGRLIQLICSWTVRAYVCTYVFVQPVKVVCAIHQQNNKTEASKLLLLLLLLLLHIIYFFFLMEKELYLHSDDGRALGYNLDR